MQTVTRHITGRAGQRGIALIIVLVVLAIMTVTVGATMYQTKMEINMVQAQLEATQAYYLARSGLHRALNLLREDMLKDMDVIKDSDLIDLDDKERGIKYDSYREDWGSNEELIREITLDDKFRSFRDERPRTSFTVRVFDESGRINLNWGSLPQRSLEHLLYLSNVPEEDCGLLAGAMIDWRDEDDQVTLPENLEMDLRDYGDQASEVTFYNPEIDPREFETSPDWLPFKNDTYDMIEELLLVPKMNYFILYGEDANGNLKTDDNEDDGDINPPFDNEDGEVFLGIIDYLTVHSRGKANINTAPRMAIEALLFDALDEEAEDAADKIVRYRNGRDRELGTDDDEPILQQAQVGLDAKGFDELDLPGSAQAVLQEVFTDRSDSFRVTTAGRVGQTERQFTVYVTRRFLEEQEIMEMYQEDFEVDELGEEELTIDDLTPRMREQVKFTLWQWDDYSFVDLAPPED